VRATARSWFGCPGRYLVPVRGAAFTIKRYSASYQEMKGPMSTEPSPSNDFASLYRRAFQEHGARALWSTRLLEAPTPEDALVVARALRIEGNRDARVLAEQIEQACRAAI
jgi:hypothetical protein